MYYKYISGLIIILTSFVLYAGEITITGQYLDKKQNPITDASVEYFANIAQMDSTTTDGNGYFTLHINTFSIETEALPEYFRLGRNYPNPFNPETHIPVAAPYPATLTIFNIRGQFVDHVRIPIGLHDIVWGGLDRYNKPVAAGIYILYVEAGDFHSSKQITLLDSGHTSRLHIESSIGTSRKSVLAKANTVDEIYFIKPNTLTKIVRLTSITQDTSLGIVTGNVGPSLIQVLPDQTTVPGLEVFWKLEDFFYSDDSNIWYFPKDTAHFDVQYSLEQGGYRLTFVSRDTGVYTTVLKYVDMEYPDVLYDSTTVSVSVIYIPPPWSLPYQTADIPDTSIAEDDKLFLDMRKYVEDNDLDIAGYWIDSLPNADYFTRNDSLWIIPEPDFNGIIDNIVIRVMDGFYPDSVFQKPFKLTVTPVNDIPRIITSIPNQTVEEGNSLIIPMKGVYVQDVDDDHIYFNVTNINNVTPESYTHEDTIIITPLEGFEGLINGFQVYAFDEHAMSEEDMVLLNSFDINVTPRVPTNLRVEFMSVYGDTILTNGTSTFKYRKMQTETPGWDVDSVAVTENGVLNIQVPRNTPLNLKGLYSNAAQHYSQGDIYAFFQKNGQTIEETALDDSLAIVTFNAENDTLRVYKLMSDFPLGDMRNIASKDGGINVGIRKFATYPVDAYMLTGDGHETPDSLRLVRHAEIEADIRTVPHQQNFAFNTQLVPNLNGLATPYFWLGIRSDYPSPGTNGATYNSETNEMIDAHARFPWQPSQYVQKIETHQALFNLQDIAGFDPNVLEEVNGLIKLNDLGRRIYSAIGIAWHGTKF